MNTPTTQREADERPNKAIDYDKLAILMAHYLAGNVPDNLYWRVDVTAEVLRRAFAVARAATDQPSSGSGQKSTEAES